ncbi:ABC-type multidrug transport system ATPase subunit [Klugiella xanthotipulae]|uniref:ABC-type multidrug transport system ATPase subunit n=1 Tax=Klugiella xanthotipulae TaxID=244735 RepID=A0A543HXL9_9MICO|nr:ABC-type multidrug transport system ATPase subunit [Klugiella xanthotipulae]
MSGETSVVAEVDVLASATESAHRGGKAKLTMESSIVTDGSTLPGNSKENLSGETSHDDDDQISDLGSDAVDEEPILVENNSVSTEMDDDAEGEDSPELDGSISLPDSGTETQSAPVEEDSSSESSDPIDVAAVLGSTSDDGESAAAEDLDDDIEDTVAGVSVGVDPGELTTSEGPETPDPTVSEPMSLERVDSEAIPAESFSVAEVDIVALDDTDDGFVDVFTAVPMPQGNHDDDGDDEFATHDSSGLRQPSAALTGREGFSTSGSCDTSESDETIVPSRHDAKKAESLADEAPVLDPLEVLYGYFDESATSRSAAENSPQESLLSRVDEHSSTRPPQVIAEDVPADPLPGSTAPLGSAGAASAGSALFFTAPSNVSRTRVDQISAPAPGSAPMPSSATAPVPSADPVSVTQPNTNRPVTQPIEETLPSSFITRTERSENLPIIVTSIEDEVEESFEYTTSSRPRTDPDRTEVQPSIQRARERAEATAGQPVVLSTFGLSKRFGSSIAVDSVNLEIRAGSFYGFVGPNGAGKTTTLSMVTGLLRPTSGTIMILGTDMWANSPDAKRLVGALPDRLRLFDRLTGAQLLYYSGILHGLDERTVTQRAAELSSALGLETALGRLVSDYSAGMQKKIALATAMIHSPRILVLDEPFESIDPVSAATVTELLEKFVAGGGSVLISSHSMELIQRVCDHVAVIVQGNVVAAGTVDDVRGEGTLESRFLELTGPDTRTEGLEWLHGFSD